jgi:two-component system sensor histidine kinase YesM
LITCHTEEEYLFFTVRNNGPQIQEEKARASLKQPGKGYGLFNIQERIALYYGEGCGLSAGLDENGYTCFTVKIKKSCTIER